MLKKLSLAGAALAMSAIAIIPATPAAAQGYREYRPGDRYDGGRDYRRDGYRGYDRGYDNRRYDERRYDDNRRGYRGCDDGDGGTVVGAIAGGLIGNEVAERGDKTLGTILGGVLGAVAGRAIDRSDSPRRCR